MNQDRIRGICFTDPVGSVIISTFSSNNHNDGEHSISLLKRNNFWFNKSSLRVGTITILLMIIILSGPTSLIRAQQNGYESPWIADRLPVFYPKLASRLDYPLSWLHIGQANF